MEVRLDEGRRHQPALRLDLDGAPIGESRSDADDTLAADADVHGPVDARDARASDHEVHVAPYSRDVIGGVASTLGAVFKPSAGKASPPPDRFCAAVERLPR